MNNQVYKNELKALLINGSALLGAYILKRATEKVLELTSENRGSKTMQEKEFNWVEAIGWAAFTGALASTLQLFINVKFKNKY